MEIKGILPAIPTPFDERGALNLHELERMLDFLLAAGVHGIFAVGNAGEFYSMDADEKRAVLKTTVMRVAGKVPVLFGAGAATTAEAVRFTRMAQEEGADAVSVITPYLIKPNDDELLSYYEEVCAATTLPVLPYNNPAVTGVSISPTLMKRIAKIGNIMGVKDSSGDLATTLEFLREKKPGYAVLAGRDGLILSTLLHGGKGSISSVSSACPELAVKIYDDYTRGDIAGATEAQLRFAQLRSMFSLGTFPSVVKAALNLRGYRVGAPRPPVAPLSEAKMAELKAALDELLHS